MSMIIQPSESLDADLMAKFAEINIARGEDERCGARKNRLNEDKKNFRIGRGDRFLNGELTR